MIERPITCDSGMNSSEVLHFMEREMLGFHELRNVSRSCGCGVDPLCFLVGQRIRRMVYAAEESYCGCYA